MKALFIMIFVFPIALHAQEAERFARALDRGRPQAIDRWMKRELLSHRKGAIVNNGSATYTVHYQTYDSLVLFLRKQPGVVDAAWDRCQMKLASWPGHSTIGVQLMLDKTMHERCYYLQEGIFGNIKLFGWRPHLRKDREQLKYLGAEPCPGFVEQQQNVCNDLLP